MLTDRTRIACKLERVQRYISNQATFWLEPAHVCRAIEAVDRLRRDARYQSQWEWEGFESAYEWAKAHN